MSVDLTADPKRMVLALALQLGTAQVATLHAGDLEWGTLYRDAETFSSDVQEADTLVTLRRRRGETNIKFAARLALKFSEVCA